MKESNLVKSPCIRNCCLNEDDNCLGCFRSIDEIISWSAADYDKRMAILEMSVQRRQAYAEKWLKT